MEQSQMTKLLVFVGSVEGREAATKLQMTAWMDLAGHLDYAAAMEAVREHYRTQPRRLYPADLIAAVRSSDAQAELDYEVEGSRLAHGRWTNSMILPRQMVKALGEIAHEGNPGALVGFLEQVEADYDMRRRLKAVE